LVKVASPDVLLSLPVPFFFALKGDSSFFPPPDLPSDFLPVSGIAPFLWVLVDCVLTLYPFRRNGFFFLLGVV